MLLGLGYVSYIVITMLGEIHFENTCIGFFNGERTITDVIHSFLALTFLLVMGLTILVLVFSPFLKHTEEIFNTLGWRGTKTFLHISRMLYIIETVVTLVVIVILVPENMEILKSALMENSEKVSFGLSLTRFLIYFNALLFGILSFAISTIMLELRSRIGFFKPLGKAYWLYFVTSIVYLIEQFTPVGLSIILYPLSCLLIKMRIGKLTAVMGSK